MVACSKYKGMWWKFLGFYAIYSLLNSIYDVGMYARFFVYGPSYFKALS